MTEAHRPTTTHAAWGSGDPHLRITRDDERWVHQLTTDIVNIGSAGGNQLILADADPVHATIVHDDHDEYVLTMHATGETSAQPRAAETGADDRSQILRTGARFTIGPWELVFGRAEFADHGRPYGGREGGEFDDQPPQPERPDYIHNDEPGPDYEVKDG